MKNIAVAASLTKLFRGGELCPAFSARDLWIHSVATAAGSKLICDEMKLAVSDEAFLAGLIHDIGIMVEMQAKRQELIQVFEEITFDTDGSPECDMREVERRILGASHETFGAALCNAWKFPKSFTYITRHHHNPSDVPEESRLLTSIVYIADRLSGQLNYGFRADLQDLDIGPEVMDSLNISHEKLAEVKSRLPQAFEDIEATFG